MGGFLPLSSGRIDDPKARCVRATGTPETSDPGTCPVRRNTTMQADYVIVGAGSAGCTLANRLTEDPNTRVVLLEAGGRDWNPLIHIPAGYMKLLDHPTLTWGFKAEPTQAQTAAPSTIRAGACWADRARSTA
jgi:choline dehydrogenase-like flavoprotein